MEWIEEAKKDDEHQNEVLSFNDYMDVYESHARREARPTFEYLIDMLNHYGKNEDGSYKLFQSNHPDAPPIFGQQKTQESIFQNLINFQEEGFNNKFILLVGPNGSSKSSIVRKLMKGAEEYSKKDDGTLYTFSWIFPIDNFVKGSLGLSSSGQPSSDLTSYAYLDDKDVSAILPSELKDHPLLLVPQKYREKYIEKGLEDFPDLLDAVKKSYLYKGDLSKRNRMIYDALLKNYKGDHIEVLKHIRVERFTLSKRYSSGAVTIEPQIHVDARMQQITMDKRLSSLPPSLQSLNLFSLQGEVVMANRGVLEYSDLLKRPLDTYKYLLMTMETANVNLGGILTELDIFFVGTSNEIHLAAFKQHPDFNSFKGRFNFIRVPYLLDYKDEEKIYSEQVDGLKEKSIFEPHSISTLCMFAVMSRLRSCMSKHYDEKKLAHIASSLNPLEKTLLLSSEKTYPNDLDVEAKQILGQGLDKICSEFENENLYEGKFGLSPRDLKKIIYSLSSEHDNVTFIEIIEYLEGMITKKNEYDFLNMTPQGDFHHPARFLALLKEKSLDSIDKELRESLGLVDDRSYEDHIKRYILHVTAMIKGEKVKNTITARYETVDEFVIKEFENSINLKEDPKKFRGHLISKLGAYSLDHPGKPILYTKVFPEMVYRLRESFRIEQKKHIQNMAKNIVFYEADLGTDKQSSTHNLSADERKAIQTILGNLQEQYHYSHRGALTVLKYVIKERY